MEGVNGRRIEQTIYWGYKSVSDPNCPSPGAKLLQETKHDAKTAGDHMGFSHGIHQVLRFQFLEQWREIPCRLIIMGTWLVMSLCVLSWSIHYWKVTHLSSRIRVKRKDQQLWYDMKWIIYIWLYDMIFPDYFFYFTSVSESGVDLCQLAFLGAIFVLKLGCRPKPWGFGLTIKKGSRWHGIFATVWWLIWLVILHKRTFSFECRDRYSISRRNSSVRHQFFQQVRCRWIHAGAISDPNQRDWGREVSFANSPGSPRLSSHGGWIGHRRILRIRFCFPPTALAPQPHGGTSETKVDSWHPLTTQDSWIMGIFWVSLNGFAEFQMQCGQLQDLKGHSVVA